MSEIPRSQPPDSVSWPHPDHQHHGQHGNKHGQRGAGYGATEAATSSPTAAAMPTDSISSLSQSIGSFPPLVRQVLHGLIEEQASLRQALSQSEGRIRFLEQQSDQHAYMPVLNRRAILRTIDTFTHLRPHPFGDESKSVGCIVLFYLVNFEKLHRHVGLVDAESALIYLAQHIASTVRGYDTVGSVGGAGILVLMPETSHETATDKMLEILASAQDTILSLHGALTPLEVHAAVYPLAMDEDSESALCAVDRLLRDSLALASP